ncbi:hypothetical protein G9P44_000549 [Scheffersomyces stipitis]|nr:hypothetical protein G9P44_000549 [Scheffersomyces stipitis]
MSEANIFEGILFLIIRSSEMSNNEISRIEDSIARGNGVVTAVKDEHNNDTNYLDFHSKETDKGGDEKSKHVTHIISRSIEFIEYKLARKSMIPVTSPEWLFESISGGRIVNYKTFNPDPKFFFKDCFVCVADNLPVGDKEAIYAGVKAFGGCYLDVLTKYTTHLIAHDLSNEKSIIASSAINNSADGEGIDIKIVLPHWIDHCITLGRRIDETTYLLPDAKILKQGTPIQSQGNSFVDNADLTHIDNVKSDFLKEKTFYVASDHNLSERFSNSLDNLIKRNGGTVAKQFNSESVDVYIGKFRTGEFYEESCRSNRIIVGNLQWFFSVIVSNEWVLPLNSNLLHYPIPQVPLDSFKDLKISITNYSGDSRAYLSTLISILGGTFTKTLTKDNHFLIAGSTEGKKFYTASKKWLDENGHPKIKIVNHLWVEECFSKWQLLDDEQRKYKYFGHGHIQVESLIGTTKLDENSLKQWSGLEDEKRLPTRLTSDNVDDSMSEDETTQSKHTSEKRDSVEDANTLFASRYGGRSAAKKAAMKLHDNMNDLNKYQEISKSSRKMKNYMEELELRVATPSKRVAETNDKNEEITTPSKKKTKSAKNPPGKDEHEHKQDEQKKPKKTTLPEETTKFRITAIMTGCESEINLNKNDLSKLSNIGIKVLADISPKYPINTLIAPKILRTEKFLRSLSQVKEIIHPNYLIEILKKLNTTEGESIDETAVFKEFSINDYSLDKFISVKDINVELGLAKTSTNGLKTLTCSDNHGRLFSQLNLNLSSCLNGGADTIGRILKDHGLKESHIIKNNLTGNNLKKALIKSSDNFYVLVAHKTKDTKLISAFKKLKVENDLKAVVVEWDWCVKSIFKMKLEPYDKYML